MLVVAAPQIGNNPRRQYMKSKYTDSLQKIGMQIHWIDIRDPEKALKKAKECNGLLLPGGGDVDPHLYGEEPIPECGEPNALRDSIEPAFLKQFLDEEKPILGICRGVQMMNVALGGTLHQHIPPMATELHSNFAGRLHGSHYVTLMPGTIMYDIFGTDSMKVNSIHHQAVKDVGRDLAVFAKSSDGFIEGVELKGYPFCVGVQWHPEHLSNRNTYKWKIFCAYKDAVRDRAGEHTRI